MQCKVAFLIGLLDVAMSCPSSNHVLQKLVVQAFSNLAERPTTIKFSPSGKLIVFGTATGMLHVWNAGKLSAIGSHGLLDGGSSRLHTEIKELDIMEEAQGGSMEVHVCAATDSGDCHLVTFKVEEHSGVPAVCNVKQTAKLSKPKTVANGSIKHCKCACILNPRTLSCTNKPELVCLVQICGPGGPLHCELSRQRLRVSMATSDLRSLQAKARVSCVACCFDRDGHQ
jgi:hypothetical protein